MDIFLKQISFSASTPLYIQLANFLEQAILQKKFDSKFLPPERELAKLLNISRVTVSNALKMLENKNLIIRQQGLGTQINVPFDYSLNQFSGFTKKMQDSGFTVSDIWLDKTTLEAKEEIALQFNVPKGTMIAYLHRVRLIDLCPISIESTYTLLSRLPEPENFTGSLYAYWAKNNIFIANKTIYFKAINCDSRSAELLNQPINTPLLEIHEINRDHHNQIIEISTIQCLSQYYDLKLEL